MAKQAASNIVTTKKAVAEHFGVSLRAITDWQNRPDPMPKDGRKYDLDEIAEWRSRTFAKGKNQQTIGADGQGNAEVESSNSKLLKAKARKEAALAEINEIKLRQMDDAFVPLEDVATWVSEFLRLQRDLLTAMPIEMFAAAPDEIRRIYQPELAEKINIHLDQMGDWIERVEDIRK